MNNFTQSTNNDSVELFKHALNVLSTNDFKVIIDADFTDKDINWFQYWIDLGINGFNFIYTEVILFWFLYGVISSSLLNSILFI